MNEIPNTSYLWKARGTIGRLQRLKKLDIESREDFLSGFRAVLDGSVIQKAAWKRAHEIAQAHGYGKDDPVPLPVLVELFSKDPTIAMSVRTWLDVQDLIWGVVAEEFEGNMDDYLAVMESYDRRGPGTLELNPDMEIPAYCKHEIHRQPGGFVGSPFAGFIHYYGVLSFYKGLNDGGEISKLYATAVPAPKDGVIKRILDMGCSDGQFSMAIKDRFPDAEVWGIDVGGPMVRFAHLRAVDLNIDVNFAQRLAEDTKFPDNHFDIVTSYILHHEVNADATLKIIKEAYRILRPGGIYFPIDAYTGKPVETDVFLRFRIWWDYTLNNEPWRMEYADVDFLGEMRKAGFEVNENGPPAWWTGAERNVVGTKPA